MTDPCEAPTIASQDAAETVGLNYASIDRPGLRRRRSGKGFTYRAADGEAIKDALVLSRVRALAIPPAWGEVWICPDPNGHIQAFGYDARGRKQYRYHARFREIREAAKFEHMMAFADVLPRLRRRVAQDMALPGLPRAKVLATVAHLLETTMIRVGNPGYAEQNKSYGLTTLLARHVRVEGSELRFRFTGKSGRVWRLSLHDRRVARIVRGCQDLPGQHLFQYLDEQGQGQAVTSADVNAYLKEITGAEITAKDFRTWTGTVLAAVALDALEAADNQAAAKKNVARAIQAVATRLGNTPTICRKCYVHPEIISAYLEGGRLLEAQAAIERRQGDDTDSLRAEEAAVLSLLRGRSAQNPAPSLAGASSPPMTAVKTMAA